MADSISDPIDHARTTRQHAGETMKNGTNSPGLVLVAIGWWRWLWACTDSPSSTVGALSGIGLAVVLSSAGLTWVLLAHREVRKDERRWHAAHPGRPSNLRQADRHPGSYTLDCRLRERNHDGCEAEHQNIQVTSGTRIPAACWR